MILELGIFTSHFIWLIRTRKVRKQAKEQGRTFDDIAFEHEELGIPFKFAERKISKDRCGRQKDAEEGPVGETRTDEPLQAAAEGKSSAEDSPEHGDGQTGKDVREKNP